MAGSLIGALRVTLGIDTAAFEKGLGIAQKRLNATGKQFERVGKKMQSIGKSMTVGITAPVVAFGVSSLKAAGDFEQAMNRTQAVSGATAQELKQLSTLAKEMGRTTQFSASEAANALGFLAMAGFDAEQSMAALPGTLQLASSAQMELAETADLVSNVLTGYNKETSELAHVNDVLVKTFTSTNTNLEMLGASMKFVGPVAASAGVRFEEVAAAIGLMGNAGIQGEMAGTALRGAISKILAPSNKAAGIMKTLGLNFTDAEGRLVSLVDIVEQLGPHANDAGLFMQLFGQRAGPAMAALVGQGADALANLDQELINSGGTAERVSQVQMKGFNGAMKRMKSAFEALQIAVAESGLIDWISSFVTGLANLLTKLSELSPTALKIATVFALIAAAVGPLLVVAGSIVSAWGAIMPLFAGLATVLGSAGFGATLVALATAAAPFIAAGAALAAAWVLFGDKIGPVLSSLKNKFNVVLGPKLQSLFNTVKTTLLDLWRGPFGQAIRVVIDVLGDFGAAYTSVLGEVLIRIISALVSAVEAGFKIVGDVLNIVMSLLTGDFSAAWESMKSLVGNVISGVINILKSLAPEAVTAVREMASAFATWLGDLASRMVTYGRNIIQGLVDGILAAPEAVWNALKSVVLSGITQIREFLGIASPSRLFMAMGGYVTEGFAIGIENGTPIVKKAMDDLGQVVADSLNGMDNSVAFKVETSIDLPNDDISNLDPVKAENDQANGLKENFQRTFTDGIKAALDGDLKNFFQNWFEDAGNKAFTNILNAASSALSNSLGSISDGSGGGAFGDMGSIFTSVFSSLFGRASGGPVMANTPYIVGEKRPEIFVPSTAGRIVPNLDELRGKSDRAHDGGGMTFNFYGPVSNPQEIKRSAAQAGAQMLRLQQMGQRGA